MRLDRWAATTVAADGTARLALGPGDAWTSWTIGRVTVSVSAGAALAALYRNTESPAHLIDATSTGHGDTAEYVDPLPLAPGERLVIVWTGAEPGAQASVTLAGAEAGP